MGSLFTWGGIVGITGVTSVRGDLAAGLLSALVLQRQTTASNSTSSSLVTGGSSFGSAYVLGGSAAGSTQNAYSLLASFVQLQTGQADADARSSANAEQRAGVLKSITGMLDRGDVSGGRRAAESLLAKNAGDVAALGLLARSYLEEGKYKKAEGYYARASLLAPGDMNLKTDLATAKTLQESDARVLSLGRRKINNPDELISGLQLLARLAERRPHDADVYVALADGFGSAEKPMQVLGALQEAVKWADEEQIDAVITRAAKFARQHPDVGITRNLLGRALQKAGRHGEAIVELEAATYNAPGNTAYIMGLADGYITRARVRLEQGRIASAKADLDYARGIDPANGQIAGVSARIAGEQAKEDVTKGRYATALGRLSIAAANAPDDSGFKKEVVNLSLTVGAYYKRTGADSAALSSYMVAYELDPTSETARDNVAALSHKVGLTELSAGRYDTAISYLERAYQTHRASTSYGTDLARAYDLRGQLRQKLGKTTDAIEDFKRAIALDPTNAAISANFSAAVA